MKKYSKTISSLEETSLIKTITDVAGILFCCAIFFFIGFYGWKILTLPAYDLVRQGLNHGSLFGYLASVMMLLVYGVICTAFIVFPVATALFISIGAFEFLFWKTKLNFSISPVLDFRVLVKLVFATLFLCCLSELPYNYYKFVRLSGMFGFVGFLGLEANRTVHFLPDSFLVGFMLFWLLSAILINPIFLIPLERTVWNIIDVVWALALVLSMAFDVVNNLEDKERI